MPIGRFKVEVVDASENYWVDVSAASQEEALHKVAQLGHTPRSVKLVEVVDSKTDAVRLRGQQRKLLRAEGEQRFAEWKSKNRGTWFLIQLYVLLGGVVLAIYLLKWKIEVFG